MDLLCRCNGDKPHFHARLAMPDGRLWPLPWPIPIATNEEIALLVQRIDDLERELGETRGS